MPDFTPRSRTSGKVSASAWNAMTQLVRREGQLPGQGDDLLEYGIQSSLQVLIRNDTGGDLAEMSIVKLGDPLVDPAVLPLDFLSRPIFKGLAPTGRSNTIAVLSEAIADGDVGTAIFHGLAVCRVLDSGYSLGWALPRDSTTGFLDDVATPTSIRILYHASGSSTGSVVFLGPPQQIGLWAKLTGPVGGTAYDYDWAEVDPNHIVGGALGVGNVTRDSTTEGRVARDSSISRDPSASSSTRLDLTSEIVWLTLDHTDSCYYFRAPRVGLYGATWHMTGGIFTVPTSSADQPGAMDHSIAFSGGFLYIKSGGSWLKSSTNFVSF